MISQAVDNEPANQKNWTKDEFINEVASHAVPLQASHGITPSVTIAQAILESNWGKSSLSRQENNYFGIKGGSTGRKYATREYEDEWKDIHASFRSYPSLEASVKDYAELINGGTEWDPQLYSGVQEASSYQEAARALYSAGYATDPTYPEKIIEIIEIYDLDRFDK
ncbi:Flagellum-specific peptidoglycan hydrolase FlgJ [Alkalibacterium subtropicum]|uniref:Flagellum-specific peptidoglycan hydrolase FlgJ n=1 Tax=Alkalibacterium subtropicum TaxID=753702 RepID=A0A1I1HMF3_9LACT|nr:glucosaminidase domain-containing protein [Alkalibacterium subtropicum]SFC25309.1 Flagellum-specific peptidoglycan hydrolase FlgJ [Alkalibacterium subtropicum]